MKNAIKLICLAFLTLPNSVTWACSQDSSTGFLPPNNLSFPDEPKALGLNFFQYNRVIDKVENRYTSIVRSHGGKLVIHRKWSSPRVNAGAYRSQGDGSWNINLYGGFARHPSITEDGYALVLCHELGHHIGGAPKKIQTEAAQWSSNEGQSDYFATLKCFRTLYENDDNKLALARMRIPEEVQKKCEQSFSDTDDEYLCMRSAMAGLSVAYVMADSQRKPHPSHSTPDTSIVASSTEKHPGVQCRLDTYFMGSVCEVDHDILISQHDELKGTCHPRLGFKDGARPQCWFKPRE